MKNANVISIREKHLNRVNSKLKEVEALIDPAEVFKLAKLQAIAIVAMEINIENILEELKRVNELLSTNLP